MPAVRSVLVVGAGAAGCATATLLADAGVSVDLIDIKPDVSALGSGITLQGNALRVLRQLGVWDQVAERGYAFDTLGLRAPDPDGTLIVELTDVRTGGEDLPATVGMYRPDLAAILVDRAIGAGAKVRFGTTYTALAQDDAGVDVTFADGSSGRYDLVVGADGIRSWTAATARHPPRDAEHRHGDLAGVRAASGLGDPHRPLLRRRRATSPGTARRARTRCTPTSSRTPRTAARSRRRSRWSVMRGLAEAYHGPWDDIREPR